MLKDMADDSSGILISDGLSSVRLTRNGKPRELGYPTIIEVHAGPFQGAVADELLDYGDFRTQLKAIHISLRGVAKLGSYEGNEIELVGDGRGAVGVRVRVIGRHVPLTELKFQIFIDQSYLPAIIQQVDAEFPPPYRSIA